MTKKTKIIRHRDADTGKYVTEQYAEENPKTTVKETDTKKETKSKKK